MSIKTDTLADWLHAWTYDTRPVFDRIGEAKISYPDAKVTKEWQAGQKRHLRETIREAKRYRLDDNFIHQVARKTIGGPTDMLAMAHLSQLPHDVVFVEYDDNTRVRGTSAAAKEIGTSYGFNPNEDYGRAGLLFERIDRGNANAWRVSHCCDSENSLPVWPYAAYFSLDQDARDIDPANHQNFAKSSFIQNLLASGWGYVDKGGTSNLQYAIHDELLQRGVAVPEGRFFLPILQGALRAAELGGRERVDAASDFITRAAGRFAAEGAGKLRWAVSILSSINVVPLLQIQHSVKGSFQHRLRNVPKLDFTTIKIDARPGHEMAVYEKHMHEATGRHNRWHEVRGHWRVVDSRKAPMRFLCAHVVAERDGNYALCRKCEHLIRWIDHHERGDEAIGKVFHDYEVKG